MHTLMVIAGGLLLLGVFLWAGYIRAGRSRQGLVQACTIFFPVWLAATLVNMTIGVVSAGYTIMQELPIQLVVFAVPAGAAGLILWRVRKT